MNTELDFLEGMFSTAAVVETPTEPTHADLDNPLTPDPIVDPVVPPADNLHDDLGDDSDEDVDDTLVGYVEFLKQNDLVVIPEDLEFTGQPDQLQKIFEHTKASQAASAVDNLFNALPDDFKPLLDYALKGGKSLTDFLDVYGNDPLATADLTKVEDQRKIIAQHYKATSNYSDEKINRLVSLITDEDDLRVEAEDCYRELTDIRAREQADLITRAEEAAKEQERKVQEQTMALATAVETTTTIHPQRKQKVRSFFFDPVNVGGKTTTGFNYAVQSILSNPEHQAQLADILLEYDPNKGFSSERLERKSKSRATESFQALLDKTLNPKQAQRASSSTNPKSTSLDWENYLKQ